MKSSRFSKLFKITSIVSAFALVAIGGTMSFQASSDKASASDCSANAIVTCGAANPADFISKVRANAPGDLPTIYASYGLAPADYNRFITSAVAGTAYKDGTIVVGGRVVATNAESIGRSSKPYSHAKVIGGKTYYESRAQDVFLSNSIGVMVLFNAKGQMQFAVMNDCGNPTNGTVVTPTYTCNNLQSRQINRTTYAFSSSATAGNGASIDHVVYNFGDGTSSTQANPATEVAHTYTKTGTFSVKVTVYVTVPGSQTVIIAAAGDCVKQIVIATPPPPPPAPKPTPVASCTTLTAVVSDRTNVALSAKAAVANGATVSGYDFEILDIKATKVLQTKHIATTATSAATSFTVSAAGSYYTEVYVVTSQGRLTSPGCAKNFVITPVPIPPVAVCKQLTVTQLDRTTYKLTGTAVVSGGATIQGYDFTVKSANGTLLAAPVVNTSALSASTNITASTAGAYSAVLSVRTSVGAKTSATCETNFTVPEKPVPPVPSVKITKTVDGQKSEQVAVGQTFTYQVVITNDGKVDLTNAAVTDKPQTNITLLQASVGTIDTASNTWSYTIPSLKIGDSTTVTMTANVPTYVDGNLVNTACVTAPQVNPGAPLCDTATVTVPPPVTPPTPPTPVTPVTPTPAPTELVNTGAGNTIGVFAVVVIASSLGYRIVLSRKLSR